MAAAFMDETQLSNMTYKQLVFEWQTTKESAGQYYTYQKKIEAEISERVKTIRDEGGRKGIIDWKEE